LKPSPSSIEVPLLDVMTQGRTRKEAFEMIKDAIEGYVEDYGLAGGKFSIRVHHGEGDTFEVSAPVIRPLIALMLLRKRVAKGVSLGEAIARLDQKSKTAWTRYEKGNVMPSIEKLAELFAAVSPDTDLVLRESRFPV